MRLNSFSSFLRPVLMLVWGMSAMVGCSREEREDELPRATSRAQAMQRGKSNRIQQALKAGKMRKAKSPSDGKTVSRIKILPRVVSAEDDAEFKALPPAEQQTLKEVQAALDEDDYEKTVAALKKVNSSSSLLVRRRAAESLSWFGRKALPEAVMFLADSDAEVRSTTQTAVEQSISEIENEAEKVATIERLMMIRGACDEDCLVMLAGELNGVADETLTVAAASRVIEANASPEGVSAMKEVYEFVTGEEYSNAEAAKEWIENARKEQLANEDQI